MKPSRGADSRIRVLATVLLPAVALASRWTTLARCRAALSRIGPARARLAHPPGRALPRAEVVVRLVDQANRVYSTALIDCLPRSLVACWLLRLEGIEGELCLGVRTLGGRFEAHAWVEVDGIPLGETDDVHSVYERFCLTHRLSGGAA